MDDLRTLGITVGDIVMLPTFRWNCPVCNQIYQLHPTNRVGDVLTCSTCVTMVTVFEINRDNASIQFVRLGEIPSPPEYKPKKPNYAQMKVRRESKKKEFNIAKWIED